MDDVFLLAILAVAALRCRCSVIASSVIPDRTAAELVDDPLMGRAFTLRLLQLRHLSCSWVRAWRTWLVLHRELQVSVFPQEEGETLPPRRAISGFVTTSHLNWRWWDWALEISRSIAFIIVRDRVSEESCNYGTPAEDIFFCFVVFLQRKNQNWRPLA